MSNRLGRQTIHVETPLWESTPLSEAAGLPVFLKMEALQPVGSFKARGMGHAARAAQETGANHLVSSSGGNAGYAVAYAGRRLGLAVTIVVPHTTSARARELISREGATLIEHGASWDDAHAHAVTLATAPGYTYVHPFDDPVVWEGHATMVHEMAAQYQDARASAENGPRHADPPGAVVVSVGGGGLLCGLLQGMHDVGWGDVPVLAVETEGADSFAHAVKAGRLVTLDAIRSLATTLGARQVAPQALAWTQRHQVIPRVVSDRDAIEACLHFADDHRVLVEPACGAALSIGYGGWQAAQGAAPLSQRGPMIIIACGGAGVTRESLESWRQQVYQETAP